MRLFSYTIPIDDGAAPNPFGGLCTLTICKPAIRRVAIKDDWIAGLGSMHAPSGDLSGRLVYAMRVDEVMSLREYDRKAPLRWPFRIPDINRYASALAACWILARQVCNRAADISWRTAARCVSTIRAAWCAMTWRSSLDRFMLVPFIGFAFSVFVFRLLSTLSTVGLDKACGRLFFPCPLSTPL